MKRFDELDIIIPISLDLDWPEKDGIIAEIREQHEKYGFTRFALACPCGGWRAIGYPPTEFFAERAVIFAQIKAALAPEGIDCGWWITATLKSGLHEQFTPITHPDGTTHGFSNCPLDPAYRERFSSDVALFAKIGKPSFIIIEDDFSINAAAAEFGCFCEHHMVEFAKREGREYTRDELTAIFRSITPEGYALLRRFRELMRDSLVGMAEAMRRAVDVDSPEIPMGYMQSGNCDTDGDVTLAVSRALAGPNHTPFSRLFGTFYGGVTPQNIPSQLFHSFYCKQHIEGDFIFYHESDTFPHTRFFTSGKDMLAIMGAAYSMGFDGSTFQTQQLVDHANEEPAYGRMFAKERARLNALSRASKHCTPRGAELLYDPFWSTVSGSGVVWSKVLSMHSIPWITTDSDVVFFDMGSAAAMPDEEIRRYLAKPLIFLDGSAAKRLCERGYGEYLGVMLGEPINDLPENAKLRFDLGAREVVREAFIDGDTGKNMPSAHMLANGNGVMLKMEVTDPACEILTDMYTYDKRYVTPAMTCFKNSLGGTVVVMAITVGGNYSQSLFNYRRQRLIHRLIAEHSDTLVFVREAPRIFTIMNDAADKNAGFSHLLTLVNLSTDELENAQIHLPPSWKNYSEILTLNRGGEWIPADFTASEDGIVLHAPIDSLMPTYLMIK